MYYALGNIVRQYALKQMVKHHKIIPNFKYKPMKKQMVFQIFGPSSRFFGKELDQSSK